MSYSEKVLDHYENPRNVGSFDASDRSIGTGLVGAPACGDVLKLQIKVENDVSQMRNLKRMAVGRRLLVVRSSRLGLKAKLLRKQKQLRTQKLRKNWLSLQSKYIVQYWRRML